MSETKERTKHLIETTARENEIINELPNLEKYGILPKNKTKVFCRGLHIAKQLAQSDEKPLLRLLVCNLENLSSELSKKNIDEIKSLASVIYSIFIAKRGILGAEIFESVPIACNYLDLINNQKIDKDEVKKMSEDIAASIRTLILKESKMVGTIDLASYYKAMAKASRDVSSKTHSELHEELAAV